MIVPNIKIIQAGVNQTGNGADREEFIDNDTNTTTIMIFNVLSIFLMTRYTRSLFSSVTVTPVFQTSGYLSIAVDPKNINHPTIGVIKSSYLLPIRSISPAAL